MVVSPLVDHLLASGDTTLWLAGFDLKKRLAYFFPVSGTLINPKRSMPAFCASAITSARI
jgi:hypothetical protein